MSRNPLIQSIPANLSPIEDDDEDTIIDQIQGIIYVSKELPPYFLYKTDSAGITTKYLVVTKNTDYDIDPNYTERQQWLINQRQGDQYDRISERIPNGYLADRENHNQSDINLLNRPLAWNPTDPFPNMSTLYEDYPPYWDIDAAYLD